MEPGFLDHIFAAGDTRIRIDLRNLYSRISLNRGNSHSIIRDYFSNILRNVGWYGCGNGSVSIITSTYIYVDFSHCFVPPVAFPLDMVEPATVETID